MDVCFTLNLWSYAFRTMASSVLGYLSKGKVRVRQEDASALHSWSEGGHGELLTAPGETTKALHLGLPEAFYLVQRGKLAVMAAAADGVSAEGAAGGIGDRITDDTVSAPEQLEHPGRSSGDSMHSACRRTGDGGGSGGSGGGSPMSAAECWRAFACASPPFALECVAYLALRREGWRVRTGIKFGADFALYSPTERPGHAELCALVSSSLLETPRTWLALQRHVRLCHQVSKGIVLCSVELKNAQLRDDGGSVDRAGGSVDRAGGSVDRAGGSVDGAGGAGNGGQLRDGERVANDGCKGSSKAAPLSSQIGSEIGSEILSEILSEMSCLELLETTLLKVSSWSPAKAHAVLSRA